MEILNRQIIPHFGEINKVEIPAHEQFDLDNGIPVYVVDAGTQELVKIEFIFPAGPVFEKKPLLASATNILLNEGTLKHSGAEIADMIDNFGAYFQTEHSDDHAFLSIFTLNKHAEKVLPVIAEILEDSIFPEKELEIFKKNSIQRLSVNNEKVDFIARNHFRELLFGNDHPYGHHVTADDYENLEREELMQFFKTYYDLRNCKIIVAGKMSNELPELLNRYFGNKESSGPMPKSALFSDEFTFKPAKVLVEKDDAVQSAIRIGKRLFNKKHPDYHGMQILNTILGGYFGSRLMTNIREDKGYTYGIGSGLASNLQEGFFYISSEVGQKVCFNAIHEIYYEIMRLRESLVPMEELQLVKNFLMGSFLRSIDGPFVLASRLKTLILFELEEDYYTKYTEKIKSISPIELQTLANQYLNPDTMVELVVGKKNVE
jgi:zinc protease